MTPNRHLLKIFFFIWLAATISPTSLLAGQENEQNVQNPAIFETIWKSPKLYNNPSSPYVQQFNLVGRYHGQYWWANSEGNSARDWENRRMYVGVNAKLFNTIIMEVQINLNDDFDPAYKGL